MCVPIHAPPRAIKHLCYDILWASTEVTNALPPDELVLVCLLDSQGVSAMVQAVYLRKETNDLISMFLVQSCTRVHDVKTSRKQKHKGLNKNL